MSRQKHKDIDFKIEAPSPTQRYWLWKFYPPKTHKQEWTAGTAWSREEAERNCKHAIDEFLARTQQKRARA
jgi:hypothetical protein